MDITIQELTGDNPNALAELAWFELVEEAEKELPLLVVGKQVLKGKPLVKRLTKLSEDCNMLESHRKPKGWGERP